MIKLLRQPLLWFAIAGFLLFVIDARIVTDRKQIIVTTAQQQRLATLWETQTGAMASPKELSSLISSWIQEEILYREALRLGLDEQDSIVRRRLIQKLGFIAESDSEELPDVAVLRSFYQQQIDDYTLPVRYSFRQLYFRLESDAVATLSKIEGGGSINELGESSMLNAEYSYRSVLDINATFGANFADHFPTLHLNAWEGPLSSGFGFHLVQIVSVHEAEITPYNIVQNQVIMDYQRYQQEASRNKYTEELTDQYIVVIESE
jgi:peptidyl-prolyl cis-trans isomerase C